MGLDDRDEGGPGECPEHVFNISALHLDGLRLRRVLTCRCGATAYQPAPGDYAGLGTDDTTYESRQPLVDLRDAHDDIG